MISNSDTRRIVFTNYIKHLPAKREEESESGSHKTPTEESPLTGGRSQHCLGGRFSHRHQETPFNCFA